MELYFSIHENDPWELHSWLLFNVHSLYFSWLIIIWILINIDENMDFATRETWFKDLDYPLNTCMGILFSSSHFCSNKNKQINKSSLMKSLWGLKKTAYLKRLHGVWYRELHVNCCIVIVIIIVITNTAELFISFKKLNLIFVPFRNIKAVSNRIDGDTFEERYITSYSLALTWGDSEWNHLF